jgi:hypothetical protein
MKKAPDYAPGASFHRMGGALVLRVLDPGIDAFLEH